MDGIGLIDGLARELLLFASVMLLIGGADDLLVDCAYFVRRAWRGSPRIALATLPDCVGERPLTLFVPAWREAEVIGAMLTVAAARYADASTLILVGCYPNDPDTIAAVSAAAARDPRIALAINPRDGPTTKADCLNVLWRALAGHDARRGVATETVVIHDAEDVAHPDEPRVFAALTRHHDVVQLPVLPLVNRGARLVSGHYADEFAEAHAKSMVIRCALGAGMPLAGAGCAIRVDTLSRVAAARGGDPFDAASLTEDYEMGLRLAEAGGRGCLARVTGQDGDLVAVRAYFPDDFAAAARQKARWMVGIALAGWDRLGWARPLALTDHWMRMRDRRAPLAVLVLTAAYLAVLATAVSMAAHWWWTMLPYPRPVPGWLLGTTTALLGWRLAMRIAFTARAYGWREGLWAVPRFVTGNLVALAAAPRAAARYLPTLAGRPLAWDKTTHAFPPVEEVLGP